jgi:hypothetical protein
MHNEKYRRESGASVVDLCGNPTAQQKLLAYRLARMNKPAAILANQTTVRLSIEQQRK